MATVLRVTAVYLILVGAVVAVHFVVNQLYDPLIEGDSLTVWRVLDVLMLIGLAAVLACAWVRKRRVDSAEGVDRAYLEANFVFYFTAALTIAFIYNWFGVEWSEPRNDSGLLWIFIDSTLPVLFVSTGLRMLRE